MLNTSGIELNSSTSASYQLATEKSLGSNNYDENAVVTINVEDRENAEDTKLPQQHTREILAKQISEQVRVIGSTVAKTVFVSNDDRIDLTLGTTVPDNFYQFPSVCCAVRWNDNFSECFGCSSYDLCLCCEADSYVMKYDLNGNHRSCILHASTLECVICQQFNECRFYRQICCFEWICGCPFNKVYVPNPLAKKVVNRDGNEVLKDSYIFNAACCFLQNCYLSCPGCCSAYSKVNCGLLEGESTCCKPMCARENKSKENLLCICRKTMCAVAGADVCFKCINQCCCCDYRCALPADEDVPLLCTILPFCIICSHCKWHGIACCSTVAKVNELKNK